MMPARVGVRMLRSRKCSAVPEERNLKCSLNRRQIDAFTTGRNNPDNTAGWCLQECDQREILILSGKTKTPVSSETLKRAYKMEC